MKFNCETKKTPVAYLVKDDCGINVLVVNDGDAYVAIGHLGVGVDLADWLKSPSPERIIKTYYKGDQISFTVEEDDPWGT